VYLSAGGNNSLGILLKSYPYDGNFSEHSIPNQSLYSHVISLHSKS
jgi:hypothetical protein